MQDTLNIETPENNKLVAIDQLDPKIVFAEDGVTQLLEKVKGLAKPKLDANTDEGREERRTLAAQIARTKTGVDSMGKDYVSELKKVTKVIDMRRLAWRNEMDALKIAVRQPLTDFENTEKARKQGHLDGMQAMRDLMVYDYEPDSADVEKRITKVTELAARDYEEFAEQAQTVADNASGRLGEKLAAVIKAEADAAELAQLRKAQAEQAEKDRIAAIEKAAEERAAQKVQDELNAANARAAAAEAKVNSPAADSTPPAAPQEDPKQVDNQAHKRKINQSIVQHLVDSCMLSNSAAMAVVVEIARGKVPNTAITY